jgi:ATP-dependent DNA helicase RecQ
MTSPAAPDFLDIPDPDDSFFDRFDPNTDSPFADLPVDSTIGTQTRGFGDPVQVLQRTFGYGAFRPNQREIIDHVIAGGNALVLMPTGGGKSMCYQIPALCRPGVGVVISPLIALMQDQVNNLRQAGIRAAALHSGLSPADMRLLQQELQHGQLDLLYVSPERAVTPSFRAMLADVLVSVLAIDEAHCVSQWGHDFRPEYRDIMALAQDHPATPRIALTATADPPTQQDIAAQLHLTDDKARTFSSSFDRPNIRIQVQAKNSPLQQIKSFLSGQYKNEAGIIYCMSRKRTEDIAQKLQDAGFHALAYHAGLTAEQRQYRQHCFQNDEAVIMVATIAFGMGIDKPDVRFVIHLDLPKTLEAYYQEIGRAGRDGLPADALLLYGLQDVARVQGMLHASTAPDLHKRQEQQKLQALLCFCETAHCRRQQLLAHFGETMATPCNNCDTCQTPVQTYDGTEDVQKLLSTAYRTGQRFGMGHLIDVLRGETSDRIRALAHDRLSVFGIGKHKSKEDWKSVIRQAIAQGLLLPDKEGHNTLQLAEACRPVLRGEAIIHLRRDPISRKTSHERRPISFENANDRALFDDLRAARKSLADDQGVPPYIIFSDMTLYHIATLKPQTPEAFLDIPGVGQNKRTKYGATFIAVIRTFLETSA